MEDNVNMLTVELWKIHLTVEKGNILHFGIYSFVGQPDFNGIAVFRNMNSHDHFHNEKNRKTFKVNLPHSNTQLMWSLSLHGGLKEIMVSPRAVALAGTKLWVHFQTHRCTGPLMQDMSKMVTDVWITLTQPVIWNTLQCASHLRGKAHRWQLTFHSWEPRRRY